MADDLLTARSNLLRRLRKFFYDRRFLEVETPLLADEVIAELHIEPLLVDVESTARRASRCDAATKNSRDATRPTAQREFFLQASPELHMKRLLADGAEAIFQITRSFRGGERGALHRPEFTIVEWYRRGDDMQAGIELLDALCQAMLDTPPAVRTSYAAAFERHVGVDPYTASAVQLADRAAALDVAVPDDFPSDDRDAWLNLLLATRVEPNLGTEAPEILVDYPAGQAALAKIRDGDIPVAERFELYVGGVELANGYHELTDAAELRRRLEAVNAARTADGRRKLPLPESLLAVMERGLPDCAGVALGFDRLLMVALGANSIDEVVALR
jgi:lysyl-tRNA synthetase class 2